MKEYFYILSTNRPNCLSQLNANAIFEHIRRSQPDSGRFLDIILNAKERPSIYFALFDRVRDSDTFYKITRIYRYDKYEQISVPQGDEQQYRLYLEKVRELSRPLDFRQNTKLWDKLSATNGHKTTHFYSAKRVLLEVSNEDFETIQAFENESESLSQTVEAASGADPYIPSLSQGSPLKFEIELRDYVAENLDLIEKGLQPWDDDDYVEKSAGKIGRIDLLARDSNNQPVVIEFKKGRGEDEVVGQICRYIGWAKENIANGNKVRGIIVANIISDKLRYAARAVPDVSLVAYEVQFTFRVIS